MTNKTIKVLHYINQFFGGIGSEEAANHPIEIRDGAVGPGLALNKSFSNDIEVIGTIIAGDNYYNEEIDHSNKVVLEEFPNKKNISIEITPSDDLRSYHINSEKINHPKN